MDQSFHLQTGFYLGSQMFLEDYYDAKYLLQTEIELNVQTTKSWLFGLLYDFNKEERILQKIGLNLGFKDWKMRFTRRQVRYEVREAGVKRSALYNEFFNDGEEDYVSNANYTVNKDGFYNYSGVQAVLQRNLYSSDKSGGVRFNMPFFFGYERIVYPNTIFYYYHPNGVYTHNYMDPGFTGNMFLVGINFSTVSTIVKDVDGNFYGRISGFVPDLRASLYYMNASPSEQVMNEIRNYEGNNSIDVNSEWTIGMDIKLSFLYTKHFLVGNHCISWSGGVANILRVSFFGTDDEKSFGDIRVDEFPMLYSYGVTTSFAFYY